MVDTQEIYNRLLGQNYYETLFSNLIIKPEGKELIGNCPFCQSDRFSISTTKPVYKCWSCNESGDWINYIQKTENKDFITVAKELADVAGITIELNQNWQQKYEQTKKRNNLFEEVQSLFSQSLPNSKTLTYLTSRGYEPSLIQDMQLGSYPNTHKVKQYLINKRFTEDEIKSSGLLDTRLEGRVTIPFPSNCGQTTGYGFRTILDETKPKYLYTKGLKRNDSLVGFQFRPYQAKRVLIVEGLIDALLLNVLKLKNYWILALGGTSLSNQQIKAIENSGVSEILLCLDNDSAGNNGTVEAIKILRDSQLRIYCFNWLGIDLKDPDEIVRSEGIETFNNMLTICCNSWSKWLANYLKSKHFLGTDLGDNGYINQCLEIESTISDPLDKRQFTETFLEHIAPFGITEDDLQLRRQQKIEQTSKSKSRQALNQLHTRLSEVVKNQDNLDLINAEETILEGLNALQIARGIDLPSPYLLSDVLSDIAKKGEGMSTGYAELDELFLIPRGAITLISARPSIGKTTLMLNLFLKQVELYPNQSFYFFSYEESKDKLAVKIIQNLAGEIISEKFNHNSYINYLKYQRPEGKYNKKIEDGISKFEEYVNSGRLWLMDKNYSDLDLTTVIKKIADNNNIGSIYIDYVQKIRPSQPTNQDWLNIKNVSQSILNCAVSLDLPIILGCQLNRATEARNNKRPTLGDLRQSGDLEQDANLVLGLYRDEKYNPNTDEQGLLEVSTLKNRNGSTDNIAKLIFSPECLRIDSMTNNYSNSSSTDDNLDNFNF